MTYEGRSSGYVCRAAQAGFSLMELLVAIAIMGIILAIAVPGFMNVLENQRRKTTKQSLKMTQSAIELFELDIGRPPERLEDLVRRPASSGYYEQGAVSNWAEGGYLKSKKVPRDSWGSKFMYRLTPEGAHPYELFSYGSSKRKQTPKVKWIRVWDD